MHVPSCFPSLAPWCLGLYVLLGCDLWGGSCGDFPAAFWGGQTENFQLSQPKVTCALQ